MRRGVGPTKIPMTMPTSGARNSHNDSITGIHWLYTEPTSTADNPSAFPVLHLLLQERRTRAETESTHESA